MEIVASRHGLREVLDGFAEVLGQVIRFDRCSLDRLLPDETVQTLHVRTKDPGSHAGSGKATPLTSEHLQIVGEGLPYAIHDLGEGAAAVPSAEMLAEGIRSVLLLPLQFRDRALGFLALGSRRARAFTEADVPPAQAAAQLLAMVMAHQNLAEEFQELAGRRTVELEQGLKDTEALLEVSHILLRAEETLPTFKRVAEVVMERTGYGCCDILVWDAERNELVLEVATGVEAQPPPPIRVPLGRGIVGTVAAERIPIVVPHVERDPRYVALYPETRSEMAVPMLAGERFLGVINVESPQPDAFSKPDLEVVGSLARQLSLWLENRLLDAQREQAERDARASALELALTNAGLTSALEELKASCAQLLQAEKLAALGTLVAGAAHELNNPLAVMQGYAQLLLEQPLPADVRERLEMVRQHAQRAGRIVEGLLGLARCGVPSSASPIRASPIRASALPLQAPECKPYALAEAVEGALALRAEEMARQNIRLRHNLDRDVLVWADREEIQQVLLNLLLNAEYALREAAEKEILLELGRAGERAELRVADSGPGIPEEALPRIFDPFFTTKPVGCGAGLGLSVCYGIVGAYGGAIHAANRPEGGAVFTILLPCVEAVEEQRSQTSEPRRGGLAGAVLVVDDEAAARFLLQEILARESYQVTAAASAGEALERLAQNSFDLVVSDIRMPEMDGFQFYAEIRRRGLQTPLIFVSAEALDPVQEGLLAESGSPLVSKPFALGEFRRLVRERLAKRTEDGVRRTE